MNRTGIEWTDLTWNPQVGCHNGCDFCYARKMAFRLKGRFGYPEDDPFKPTFHPNRLEEPYGVSKKFKSVNPNLKQGQAMIFTCSMGDMAFAKPEDVEAIMKVIESTGHNYQILTKKPQALRFNFPEYKFPHNLTLGVSVNKQDDLWRIWELIKHKGVVEDFPKALRRGNWKTMLSIEPLHEPIDLNECEEAQHLDWIVVGAETGNRKGKIEPKSEWVDEIVSYSNKHKIPLFIKDNMKVYYQENLYHEFPT